MEAPVFGASGVESLQGLVVGEEGEEMSGRTPKRKRSSWFAFYPDDFDGGTRSMSLAGKGAFLCLLGYQFNNGSVPSDDKTICRIIGAFLDEWKPIRLEVLAKFERDSNGSLVNRRMEKEREEREGIRAKRVEAINKRWGKNDTSVSDLNKQNGYKPEYKDPVLNHTSPTTTTTTVLSTPKLLPEIEKTMIQPASLCTQAYDSSTPSVATAEGGQAGNSDFSQKEEGKDIMPESAFINLARKLSVPEDFAVILFAELSGKNWIGADGARIGSPGAVLKSSWQREEAKREKAMRAPSPTERREAWMIDADIKRVRAEIAKIEGNKGNRNLSLGHSASWDEHKRKHEEDWLAVVSGLYDEAKEKLPKDVAEFEKKFTAECAEFRKSNVPDSALADYGYRLAKFAEFMPVDDVPDFARWEREWNPKKWVDPKALKPEAKIEVGLLRKSLAKLENERREVLK